MDNFRLGLFSDGELIDDLVVEAGNISITLVSAARYEVAITCDTGRQFSFAIWTTENGIIDTRLCDVGEWITVQCGDNGKLMSLSAPYCSMHFEHLDRGHYWMGLDHSSGDTMHINFSTRGYLKTKVLNHIPPETT